MTGGFACLDICWHPANFLLPHLRPELAALLQVLSLLELLLLEVAADHRLTVLTVAREKEAALRIPSAVARRTTGGVSSGVQLFSRRPQVDALV